MIMSIEDAVPDLANKLPHELRARIINALDCAIRYGQIDGDHHKAWVIDQVVRMLSGTDYDGLVTWANDGDDGHNTYEWGTGIAP